MKTPLKTLIRLARQDLDNQRVELLNLSEQLHRLDAQLQFLKRRLEEEAQVIINHPEFQQDFDIFRRYVQDRCVELQRSKEILEDRFKTLQEQVRDLFARKKSYEIALNRSIQKVAKEKETKDQAFLDEIAGNKKRQKMPFKRTVILENKSKKLNH